jgi:hypothetical protein
VKFSSPDEFGQAASPPPCAGTGSDRSRAGSWSTRAPVRRASSPPSVRLLAVQSSPLDDTEPAPASVRSATSSDGHAGWARHSMRAARFGRHRSW